MDAATGSISDLETDYLTVNDTLVAHNASIETLNANVLNVKVGEIEYATITKALEATNANVYNLLSTYGKFEDLTANQFEAINGTIESLSSTYANIDFSNIGKAAMEYFYATSGLIKDVTIGDATITGELVGVTISGDLIKGNTIVADKLVIKGDGGLYYKLNTDGIKTEAEQTDYNSLDGSLIQAKSVVASKIDVKDLVAFEATIGGFTITENSIYSGVKETVDNTTRGIYLDNDGQVVFGDNTQFIKYYKDSDGDYIFKIDTEAISFGDNYLYLAKNSRNATIDMCNGLATMYHASKYSYDSLFVIDTAVVEIIGSSTPLCLTSNSTLDNTSIQFANANGVQGGIGIIGNYLRRFGKNMFDTYTILDKGNFTDVMDSGWYYGGVLGEKFTLYNNNEESKVKYRKIGKIVSIRGTVKPTTTIPAGTTNYTIFTLPEEYRPSATVNEVCQGSGGRSWLLSVTANGEVRFARYSDGLDCIEADTSVWLPFHMTFFAD